MATVDVLNWKKEKVGKVDLDPAVFGLEVQKDLLFTVVKWQLDTRRSGTHMTKTKGLVSGGGKKPFKQKGTGNARQGSSRSILMPGGGTAFGPQPRDYSFALPKKMRRKGLAMALSYLHSEGRLFVVEDMDSKGKTGELSKRLKNFGLDKALLIDGDVNPMTKRATRNLAKYKYLPTEGANVFDILKYDAAILDKSSVAKLTERCLLEKK